VRTCTSTARAAFASSSATYATSPTHADATSSAVTSKSISSWLSWRVFVRVHAPMS
jgi:hypothetical protein